MSRQADKAFGKLPIDVRRLVKKKIDSLAIDPRPFGAKKLANGGGEFRVRVGVYRIIYEVHDRLLIVLILDMGHRSSVYRRR